jgi:hypothetical protein
MNAATGNDAPLVTLGHEGAERDRGPERRPKEDECGKGDSGRRPNQSDDAARDWQLDSQLRRADVEARHRGGDQRV